MSKIERKSQECVLTGYDLNTDKISPVNGMLISVPKLCEEGGIEALLKTRTGLNSVRGFLYYNSKLEFAGNENLLNLFYNKDKEDIENFRNRNRSAFVAAPAMGMPPITEPSPFTTVKVYYASDRKFTGSNDIPSEAFNGERNQIKELTLGTAEVSIPISHQKGQLEEASVFSFDVKNNTSKFITILNVTQSKSEEFFAALRNRVNASKMKEAFIFIHGYNNSFSDSIRRTAQMAYDLNFDGAPIAYTWPSGEKLWQYPAAEGNARWTVPHFQKFLNQIAEQSGAQRIHLIAHSMGNRVLVDAVSGLKLPKFFQQIVMAAPDIDTEVFADLEKSIASAAARVTIYASDHDEALATSEKLHTYKRLGQGGKDIFTSALCDTVDASKVDLSTVGHSYIGDNTYVLHDLATLLKSNTAPKNRPGLTSIISNKLPFWQLQIPAG